MKRISSPCLYRKLFMIIEKMSAFVHQKSFFCFFVSGVEWRFFKARLCQIPLLPLARKEISEFLHWKAFSFVSHIPKRQRNPAAGQVHGAPAVRGAETQRLVLVVWSDRRCLKDPGKKIEIKMLGFAVYLV